MFVSFEQKIECSPLLVTNVKKEITFLWPKVFIAAERESQSAMIICRVCARRFFQFPLMFTNNKKWRSTTWLTMFNSLFSFPTFLLFFFNLQLLITLIVSSNSSVFLLFTASDYPSGIFKLFGLSSIYSLWLSFWYLQTLVFLLFTASDYPFESEAVNWRKREEFEDTKRIIRSCK
jgi:hypothetical protein